MEGIQQEVCQCALISTITYNESMVIANTLCWKNPKSKFLSVFLIPIAYNGQMAEDDTHCWKTPKRKFLSGMPPAILCVTAVT